MHCEETANCQLSPAGRLAILPTATAGFSPIKFPSRGIVANFIPAPAVFPAAFPRKISHAGLYSISALSSYESVVNLLDGIYGNLVAWCAVAM